jgi:hypothetical protein
MKRLLFVILLIGMVSGATFALTADADAEAESETDPIKAAIEHAGIDGFTYEATGWGWLAFGASSLVSPLLGGGGVIIAASMIDPNEKVPLVRRESARQEYSGSDFLLYQEQYRDSIAEFIQSDRSRRAWIGAGISLGVSVVFWVSYYTLMVASYSY